MTENIYLNKIYQNLPRLLSAFDRDITNPSFGMGDRYYWAWKLIDFPNGTFQGAAHGLARLLRNDQLPEFLSQQATIELINVIFTGAKALVRRNGSLEEAFPYESSYCVTALGAFDLLSAVEILGSRIDKQKQQAYIAVVKPMMNFLFTHDETHAFISNHIATAAAAFFVWHRLTDDVAAYQEGKRLIELILKNQSKEGWLLEYQGADPGYQTLAMYYISLIMRHHPELQLEQFMCAACEFLQFFIHPDGSFAGTYGSRNTRFYFPGGLAAMAMYDKIARGIHQEMTRSITRNSVITLDAVDIHSLIPMFNAYCLAAEVSQDMNESNESSVLPCHISINKHFTDAGLYIVSDDLQYTVVNYFKGGVCARFDKQTLQSDFNHGYLATDKNQKYYSNQYFDKQNTIEVHPDKLIIMSQLSRVDKPYPTPNKFGILRLLCMTAMRIKLFNRILKKILVALLIDKKRHNVGMIERTIDWSNGLSVCDQTLHLKRELTTVKARYPFNVIHMASSGFWQCQDSNGDNNDPKI